MAEKWLTIDKNTIMELYPDFVKIQDELESERSIAAIRAKYKELAKDGYEIAWSTPVSITFEEGQDMKVGDTTTVTVHSLMKHGFKPMFWSVSNSRLSMGDTTNTHPLLLNGDECMEGTHTVVITALSKGSCLLMATLDDVKAAVKITIT